MNRDWDDVEDQRRDADLEEAKVRREERLHGVEGIQPTADTHTEPRLPDFPPFTLRQPQRRDYPTPEEYYPHFCKWLEMYVKHSNEQLAAAKEFWARNPRGLAWRR